MHPNNGLGLKWVWGRLAISRKGISRDSHLWDLLAPTSLIIHMGLRVLGSAEREKESGPYWFTVQHSRKSAVPRAYVQHLILCSRVLTR